MLLAMLFYLRDFGARVSPGWLTWPNFKESPRATISTKLEATCLLIRQNSEQV